MILFSRGLMVSRYESSAITGRLSAAPAVSGGWYARNAAPLPTANVLPAPRLGNTTNRGTLVCCSMTCEGVEFATWCGEAFPKPLQ
jgi:hypothetical protein